MAHPDSTTGAGLSDRIVSLAGAVLAALLGVLTMWSGVNAWTVILFGAAVVLLLGTFVGTGAPGRAGVVAWLAAIVMAYAGIRLIGFAARQFQASRRLADPGSDFVIEGVLAAAGVALVLTPLVMLARRSRR